MPTPRRDETRAEWMDRCIPVVIREGKTPEQAAGQCAGMWDRRRTENMAECECGGVCDACRQQALIPEQHRITLHAHQDGAVRRETHDGTEHLVVPVVAVVEGVLNNQLVLASEFSKPAVLATWNGVPVPVQHPVSASGQPISANSPQVVENQVIGRLYHCHVDGKKLKGEIWINIEKAERLGHGQVVTDLEDGKPMEVSTGYFAEVEEKSGVFGNESYSGVQHNIAPDHLALLPGGEGACNWADGCGAPRVHQKTQDSYQRLARAMGLRVQQESLSDLVLGVQEAVMRSAPMDSFRFVVDVLDDGTVVFEVEDGGLFLQPFDQRPNGTIELTGQPTEVRLEKNFVPVSGSSAPGGDNPEEDVTVPDQNEQHQMTEEDRAKLSAAESIINERREEYIAGILSNKANPYTEDELKAMSFDHLRGLYKFATAKPAEDGEPQPTPNYADRGGPAPTVHNRGEVEALPVPEAV